MIKFTIPIIPQSKLRPRFARMGRFVKTYTPKKTREYEKLLLAKALPFKPQEIFTGPIQVKLSFGMPIPKSFSKKKRLEAISGELAHTKTPDLDNIIKGVFDSLNGIFFKDDKQIISLSAVKGYAEIPFIEVEISIA